MSAGALAVLFHEPASRAAVYVVQQGPSPARAQLVSGQLNTSDWIGITGIGVTLLVGVVIALIQGHRAGLKAQSAREAAESARRTMAAALAYLRIPELEALEQDLRTAVDTGNRKGAATFVVAWRRLAPEYQALLHSAGVSDPDLDKHLKLSLGLVDVALEELGCQDVRAVDACRRILRAIGAVCGHGRRVAIGMMMSGFS